MLVPATEKEALAQMKVQSKSKRPKVQPDLEAQGKRVRGKVLKDQDVLKTPESTAKSKVRPTC